MKYKYALFDLDGTILDTKEGVISAAVYAMKQYGKEVPKQKKLEMLIGPPMQESFQKLFRLSDSEAMEMANVFRDTYKTDEYLFKAEPYDGVYDLLKNIVDSGIKVGIATYKREDYAKRLLSEKKFDEYTNYMYGSDFDGKLKKQEIIRRCLKDMGCTDFRHAVYVGDGESDGKAADLVGMDFIAVSYGFGFKASEDSKKFNPIGVAKNCKQIGEIMKI